jgi:hypothetical protein
MSGGLAQAVEHPPSKHEALISNPNTVQKASLEGNFVLTIFDHLHLEEVYNNFKFPSYSYYF